jgi:hypothetical protein
MGAGGASHDWREANQRYLIAALGIVRATLERHVARQEHGEGPSAQQAMQQAAACMSSPPAIETLKGLFHLSPFERSVLLLCAGVELDSGFAAACAAAQGDATRTFATFSLALAALPGAHWSALTPAGPLRYWRLLDIGAGSRLTVSPLRIDERILHCLTGLDELDDRLRALAKPLGVVDKLLPSYSAIARRAARIWSDGSPRTILQLCGAERAAKMSVAAAACAELDMPVHAIDATAIPAGASERENFARLWEREALLSGRVLVIDGDDFDAPESIRPALSLAESMCSRLFVSTRQLWPVRGRPVVRLDVDKPGYTEQTDLWMEVLGPSAQALDGHLERVQAQFHFGPAAIQSAAAALTSPGREPSPAFAPITFCSVSRVKPL